MRDLSARVAALPPEKRRVLERLVADRARAATPGHDAPPLVALDAGKQECQSTYDALNRSLNATMFGDYSYFLNYGYVPDSSRAYAPVVLPDYCVNKNSMRLVLETIGDCPVDGRHVLDVGCGRGGTVAVLKQFFRPAFVYAVDLSPAAVEFCRRAHRDLDVHFDQADAEHLPFGDASFEIVVNIESSSCYPDRAAFYGEVWRVLRSGGWFLYTDCLPVGQMREAATRMRALGFELVRDRDITRNVLLSCDEVASARISSFAESTRGDALASFLGAPGSANYECMRSGQWSYRILTIRKPLVAEGL